MNEKKLIEYYNKFNEDKRLKTKHGNIEYMTAMKYINFYINKFENPKILDIGAGTGAYSIPLSQKYDVTSVELVKHNLKQIEKKNPKIKLIHGNATKLNMLKDEQYDIILLFGPMYHLISMDDKIKALNEAKRLLKPNGFIFISYCMNEYAVITHGFKENYISKCIKNGELNNSFKIISKPDDLYSYVRLEDINYIKKACNLKRKKIISQDGPTEYLKKEINMMNDEIFNIFFKYHLSICEKKEFLGASRHVLDILYK